jgi:hypothetical protein
MNKTIFTLLLFFSVNVSAQFHFPAAYAAQQIKVNNPKAFTCTSLVSIYLTDPSFSKSNAAQNRPEYNSRGGIILANIAWGGITGAGLGLSLTYTQDSYNRLNVQEALLASAIGTAVGVTVGTVVGVVKAFKRKKSRIVFDTPN